MVNCCRIKTLLLQVLLDFHWLCFVRIRRALDCLLILFDSFVAACLVRMLALLSLALKLLLIRLLRARYWLLFEASHFYIGLVCVALAPTLLKKILLRTMLSWCQVTTAEILLRCLETFILLLKRLLFISFLLRLWVVQTYVGWTTCAPIKDQGANDIVFKYSSHGSQVLLLLALLLRLPPFVTRLLCVSVTFNI